MVNPMLAGAEAQARLQADDLLAPGGEAFLVFFPLLFRWHLLLIFGWRLELDYHFQLPGGKLAQTLVDGGESKLLVLHAERARFKKVPLPFVDALKWCPGVELQLGKLD